MLHFDVRRFCLGLLVLLIVVVALIVVLEPVSGDNDLARIEAAIEAQGLDWTAKVYDRTFSLGALVEDGPEPEYAPSRAPVGVPQSIDWRTAGGVNWVSPVGDQGPCGACWAFAPIATMESEFRMQNGAGQAFYDLSEQIVVSCDEFNGGCSGGYLSWAAQFLVDEGTYIETCYPYIAQNGLCEDACLGWRDSALKLDSYTYVPRSVSNLRQALQLHTVQVCFDVRQDFLAYGSGVYEMAWGNWLGRHAVQLVGYQDTPGEYGGGYFICKNSWGTGWGEDGFFRIGYSQVPEPVSFGTDARYYTVSPRPIAHTLYWPNAWYAMQGGE